MLLVNFENKTYPGLLNDFSMCGYESKHSSEVLANTLINLYGPKLQLNHLAPYSLCANVLHFQSLLGLIHSRITQICFTQLSPSLRLYKENISNSFPLLNMIFVNMIDVRLQFDTLFVKSGVKYLFDFSDNLQLFLNKSTMPSLPKM